MLLSEAPDYAREFGRFADRLSPGSLDDQARRTVAEIVFGSLRAAFDGSHQPELARLFAELRGMSGWNEATVLRDGFPKIDRGSAAFLNAVAGSFRETDADRSLVRRIAMSVVPTAFAEAEACGASGGELAVAIVVGYEAAARVARATRFARPVGEHFPWASIASAVAVAKLRGGGPERMIAALSIGASLTLNTIRLADAGAAVARGLWTGEGCRAGFLGNDLIEAGFLVLADAPTDTFSRILGDAFDPSAFCEGLDPRGGPGSGLAIVRDWDERREGAGRDASHPDHSDRSRTAPDLYGIADVVAMIRQVAGGEPSRAPAARSTAKAANAGAAVNAEEVERGRDALEELVDFVARTRYEDCPDEVRRFAKRVLVDDVGAILRGSAEPEMRALAERQGRRARLQSATLLAPGGARTGPLQATLINGTAACFVEADGGHWFAPAHGGIYTIPAGLAWGEHVDASTQDFLCAVILGYEVAARMAASTRLVRPVHPHGIWSVLASAVTVARLMKVDTSSLREAVSMAACLTTATSYRNAFEGATVRNAYNGRSGCAGILAALAARVGLRHALGDPGALFGTVVGEAFDPGRLTTDLGRTFEITRHYHKRYATDGTMHPGIDAMIDLRRRHRIEASRVDRIQVETFRQATWRANPAPTTLLGARYSYPWALATVLVRGAAGVEDFTRESLGDSAIAGLARRVALMVDDEMAASFPHDRRARVTVFLEDGSHHSRTVANPAGGYHDPMSDAELGAKFVGLTEGLVREPAGLLETVRGIDRQATLREFTRRIRESSARIDNAEDDG